MNNKILKEYQVIINENLDYLRNNSIRSSLESYRNLTLGNTAKLKSQEDKDHNLQFIHSFYKECTSTLDKDENRMNDVISQVITKFKSSVTRNIRP